MNFKKEGDLNEPKFDFCIVGAGPSGLTAAYQLLKAGKSVVLIERDNRTGGLAKSHNYGGQIFDTGPKRFHTDDPIVLNFITEITKGYINKITRSTKVYFLDKYFEWPLQSKDLLKMPPVVSMRCALDMLKKDLLGTRHLSINISTQNMEKPYMLYFLNPTHRNSCAGPHPRQPVVAAGFADGAVMLVRIDDGALIEAKSRGGSAVSALGWEARGQTLAFGTEAGEAGVLRL